MAGDRRPRGASPTGCVLGGRCRRYASVSAGCRPDRPSERREILGADGNRAAVDATDTGDERIGRRRPGEGADLGERAIVEQGPDAAASVETAGLAASGEFVGAPIAGRWRDVARDRRVSRPSPPSWRQSLGDGQTTKKNARAGIGAASGRDRCRLRRRRCRRHGPWRR